MVRIWSQPTPMWRSASRRHSAASGGGAPSRRSSTTKSLPAPCILLKRRPARAAPACTASGVAITVVAGGRDRILLQVVAFAVDVRVVHGVRVAVVLALDGGVLEVVGVTGLVRIVVVVRVHRPFVVFGGGRREQRTLVAARGQGQRGAQQGEGQQGADVHARSLARRRFGPHPQPRADR